MHTRRRKCSELIIFLSPSFLFLSPSLSPPLPSSSLSPLPPLSPDLMPGKVFSEQIADMIKSGCRKTIVLLSPDYLESEWCSYEARMALHESPGNDCSRVSMVTTVEPPNKGHCMCVHAWHGVICKHSNTRVMNDIDFQNVVCIVSTCGTNAPSLLSLFPHHSINTFAQ